MVEINFRNYDHKENFLEIVVLDILGTILETEEKNFIGGKCKITSPFLQKAQQNCLCKIREAKKISVFKIFPIFLKKKGMLKTMFKLFPLFKIPSPLTG